MLAMQCKVRGAEDGMLTNQATTRHKCHEWSYDWSHHIYCGPITSCDSGSVALEMPFERLNNPPLRCSCTSSHAVQGAGCQDGHCRLSRQQPGNITVTFANTSTAVLHCNALPITPTSGGAKLQLQVLHTSASPLVPCAWCKMQGAKCGFVDQPGCTKQATCALLG